METRLFTDAASLVDELNQAAQSGKYYQLVLVDRLKLSTSAERDILLRVENLNNGNSYKIALDWADDLLHGNEAQWDMILLRPVTWRKLIQALNLSTITVQQAASTKEKTARAIEKAAENVLVVEDSLSLQMITQARLEKFGYQVKAVSNGREAIEAIEENDFDLVLMDIQMPEMDGVTATRIIREMSPATKANEEEYLAGGMNGYLTKPVEQDSLINILQRWMSYSND